MALCLLPATAAMPPPAWAQAAAQPALTRGDVEAGLAQMEALGGFFGAFAARDTNGFAQERWRRLSLGYPGTAAILRDLLRRDLLRIDDLPDGRVSGLLDHGEIVLDSDLDGRWLPNLLQPDRRGGGTAARRLDLLMPALFEALARRQPPQDWPWLADHLRAVGGLGTLAQDPVARPLLARFFQAKDAYLWLAMQRIAEGDPGRRKVLGRRQTETFNAIRGLATDMAATFGAPAAKRLQDDWSEYVALVDGFAVTRGWLLLDPALRQTQMGAAARREADAVGRAAAEVMAAAPRSALAAARAEAAQAAAFERSAPRAGPSSGSSSVNLGAIAAQTQGADLQALAAELPLQALALRPEVAVGGLSAASYRAFAERLREAAARPDPQRVIAEREQQLGAARQEVATLQSRVGELAGALERRAAEAEKMETALVAERARVAASEQRAAEVARAAEQRLAEAEARLTAQQAEEARATEERAAQERAAEERAVAERAAAEKAAAEKAAAERASAPPPVAVAPHDQLGPVLDRMERRQLYMMAAIAVIVLIALVLWLRGRHRASVHGRAPLLLTAPAAATTQPAAAAPERPIIEVPEEAPKEAMPPERAGPQLPEPPAQLPRTSPHPGQPVHVNGVTPQTAEAKAAMKAGSARREAARASGDAAGEADLRSEADAAANPIVQALRKGNLPLFELLFSEMTDLRAPQLQRIVYGGRGEDLAIVCRAVGVDKLLFGSIFMLTDHLRSGDADEEPERTAAILRMYDRMPPATAQKVLAKWQRNWSGGRHREPPADG